MKKFLICLVLPLTLFSGEVREIEFHYKIWREIKEIDEAIITLNDPSDVFVIYWLQGIKEGLLNAEYIFNECLEHRSGCDDDCMGKL